LLEDFLLYFVLFVPSAFAKPAARQVFAAYWSFAQRRDGINSDSADSRNQARYDGR